ncbi:hypothetical protein ACFLQU_05350, partial [Verrucomicrobiota bacterium]
MMAPKDMHRSSASKVAEYVFRHMAEIWERLGIELKLEFQKTVFSHGLSYHSKTGFGTPVSTFTTKVLEVVGEEKSPLARHPFTSWNRVRPILQTLGSLQSIV